MKRTKKPAVALELVDALAELIADRVVTKLAQQTPPAPKERLVPKWLPGPKRPKSERQTPIEQGPWTPDGALRAVGLVTFGEPGYADALKKYLEREAERERRTLAPKAAWLLEQLLMAIPRQPARAAVPRGRSRRVPPA